MLLTRRSAATRHALRTTRRWVGQVRDEVALMVWCKLSAHSACDGDV